jgi:Rubisco Assembly chaperone C-terminal domain
LAILTILLEVRIYQVMTQQWIMLFWLFQLSSVQAWMVGPVPTSRTRTAFTALAAGHYHHGDNACFLPLRQLEMDYYAPRIIPICGTYPGELSRHDFMSVGPAEAAADPGQWTYGFDEEPLGTVAIEGSVDVQNCQDPVVIIANHQALGIPLAAELTKPVDLTVLVDRAVTAFAERKFVVVDTHESQDGQLSVMAFDTKAKMPATYEILGRVILVQIPWLPSMAPTRSGFMEADEFY